jgi:hypothetical protein
MNENLKQLVEQAGYYPDECDSIRPNFHDVERDRYMKFSQLLVEQCAQIVQNAVDHRIPASEYPTLIRQHFSG